MVTIIIPTYKRATYIKRAIESILNQTYKNIEIIIVDDNGIGTKEQRETEKILSEYILKNKIKYIKHKKNMNGANARNTGIKLAKGEYITFLDDDDFFLKNRLEKLVETLNNNKDYDCAYTGAVKVENGKIVDIYNTVGSGNFKYEMLLQNSFFRTGSNMFFRTKALRNMKGFDGTFTRFQDIEIMVRFFRKYKIIEVKEHSVIKDDSSRINMSNIDNLIKMKEHFFDVFEKDINESLNNENIYRTNYQKLINFIPDNDIRIEKVMYNAEKKQIYGLKKNSKKRNKIIVNIFKMIRGLIKKYIFLTRKERKGINYYIKKYRCD